MVDRRHETSGKAYGFFYSNASKQDVETQLPRIYDLVNTPPGLELYLMDVSTSRLEDKKGICRKRYFLEATIPRYSNRNTAVELSAILNQAYQSPLYKDGEAFDGEILY